jgi:site-specific DNA recombinase
MRLRRRLSDRSSGAMQRDSVALLRAELDRLGILIKRRARAGDGWPADTGSPAAPSDVLQNRIDRGDIVHQGEAYPGQHEALIDPELWQIVQEKLIANRHERARGSRSAA